MASAFSDWLEGLGLLKNFIREYRCSVARLFSKGESQRPSAAPLHNGIYFGTYLNQEMLEKSFHNVYFHCKMFLNLVAKQKQVTAWLHVGTTKCQDQSSLSLSGFWWPRPEPHCGAHCRSDTFPGQSAACHLWTTLNRNTQPDSSNLQTDTQTFQGTYWI